MRLRSGRVADEALSAGAVARRLGVAVTTLRSWHRRYGLGPSRHVPGQHRRYTTQDLSRLEVMLRLTAQGVAPAEAAAWARRTPAAAIPAISADPPTGSLAALFAPDLPGTDREGKDRDGGDGKDRDGWDGRDRDGWGRDGEGRGGRDGGGLAIPLGRVVPAARGLARAAMRLDAPVMRTILEGAITAQGVIAAWNDVAMPVLIGIGERFQATQRFVEVEHLISRCVTEAFGAVPRPAHTPPRVLLAAADEEQHTLALEALAAALAELGIPSRLLGARVPPPALADAISRTGPTAVVLWSQVPSTGDPTQLTRLATHQHPPLILAAAGPGWPPAALPHSVAHLTTLVSAVELVQAATT